MYSRVDSRSHRLYDCPGIFFGLEQRREVKHGIACDRYCLFLQPNVRIKLEVFVLSPPALLPCLPGKPYQISRSRLVDTVELAQVADVTKTGPTRSSLQTADLSRGA